MDIANIAERIEAKRKELTENGTLIPFILGIAALVAIAIAIFASSDSKQDETKGVNVVVNLNDRRKGKMARRDPNDIIETEPEPKPARVRTNKDKNKNKNTSDSQDKPDENTDSNESEENPGDDNDSKE